MEIISFSSVIEKITRFAEIFCEFNSAVDTLIGNALLMIAFRTYNLFYFKSVYFMGFIFIMTKATCVNFSTTGGYKFTVPEIMFAVFHLGSYDSFYL
jgi:hypothetical protein